MESGTGLGQLRTLRIQDFRISCRNAPDLGCPRGVPTPVPGVSPTRAFVVPTRARSGYEVAETRKVVAETRIVVAETQ